jgi:hypothetical protein
VSILVDGTHDEPTLNGALLKFSLSTTTGRPTKTSDKNEPGLLWRPKDRFVPMFDEVCPTSPPRKVYEGDCPEEDVKECFDVATTVEVLQ